MKTIVTTAILLLTFALCGCSTSRDVYTAQGATVYAIDCYAESTQSCMEKAGELCGTLGYHFVSPDGARVSAESVLNPPAATETTGAGSPPPPTDPKSASMPRSSSASAPDASSRSWWPFKDLKLDRKLYIACRT